jgi:hypothetical protein
MGEADHSPPSSVEVKNERSYISTPSMPSWDLYEQRYFYLHRVCEFVRKFCFTALQLKRLVDRQRLQIHSISKFQVQTPFNFS